MRPHRSSGEQEGFALVTVLWMLGLLGLIAISVSFVMGSETKSTANVSSRIKNELLVDGFARLVIADITQYRKFRFGNLPMTSGLSMACRYGSRRIVVTITDTAGLVDLNSGSEEEMKALLAASGVPESNLRDLVYAIRDYRDPDNDAADGGLETEKYRTANLVHLPKNGPFEVTGELDQVHGMPVDVYVKIRPYITTNSYTDKVSRGLSPLPLQKMMAGEAVDPAALAEQSVLFNNGLQQNNSAYDFSPRSRAADIRIHIIDQQGSSAGRHAVIEVTPGQGFGYELNQWEKITATPLENLMMARGDLTSCFDE